MNPPVANTPTLRVVDSHAGGEPTRVIFFNNVGVLGMCGHGTIGLVATLAHLGRIRPGEHRIDTPVGVVTATLHPDASVSILNVPCFRKAKGVAVDVPGHGKITGRAWIMAQSTLILDASDPFCWGIGAPSD